ncbi:TonB-dependent receptor [Desulfopila inferna]|uniref:TonB-dependent receptor n=1 Tax=Desulfopila inferna TaxID=468528 RepID=UPI001965A89F|nr:TonB-dependent receptor [Desulfopila inferna]MBM9604457.1 TonB-dependent receptor [Desulfopila inferna]
MFKVKIGGLKGSDLKEKTLGFGSFFTMTAATTLSLSGVFISGNVHATADEVPLMDKVVVTASRQEEKIAAVPANVTVITAQEIAKSPAETVPELLRITPGIVVNDITGNGRNITVDLRGFGETAALNTLLLIDGRRINQADLSGVDWTLIPKNRVERIEIIHGGRGSVLYGDNAAGGVINIITKKGEELLFSGGLVAGSYDTILSRLAVSGSTESLSYALSTNYRTSDGYRDNSGTDARDMGLNLDYFFSDRFNVALTSSYHEDDTEVPGSLLLSELESGVSRRASTTPEDFSDIKDYHLQIVPQVFFTETSYFQMESSTRRKENTAFFSFVGGTYNAETEIDTVALSPQIVINEKFFGRDSKLVAGFDYRKSKEDIGNESVFFGAPSSAAFELSKEDMGVYGNAEVSLNSKVAVSGGYRHDRAEFESFTDGLSDKVTMDEDIYDGGVTYRFSDNGSAYFSYAKSFRYPVLDEMFSFFTNSFDSTLRPQTTDDFEVGARIQFGPDINFSVNLFRLDTEREIFFNPVSFANENLNGDTIRQGIELKASKQFSKISVNGSYTLRDTEIDGGTFDGKEIPNVPRHQFTAGAEADIFTNFRFNIDGSYIGERPFISDFANVVDDQDGYFYVTAKLAYMFEKGSAYLTVNNLFDEDYYQYGGINFLGEPGIQPAPGVNFLVGLTFDI